jgi:hypothetical protein
MLHFIGGIIGFLVMVWALTAAIDEFKADIRKDIRNELNNRR